MTDIYCDYSYHNKSFSNSHVRGLKNYLLRLQTEGKSSIFLNGRWHCVKKGDLLLAKPGDHYELAVDSNTPSGDYYMYCNNIWMDQWWERTTCSSFVRIGLDSKLISLWNHLIVEIRRPALQQMDKELIRQLFQTLCLYLERTVQEASFTSHRPYVVTQMMHYIEEYAIYNFTISQVADHVGLSVSRASYLFKSTLGQSMIDYAMDIRLSASINQMMYTSMTLSKISENCGFGTYPYFHRVFKRKYGMSPGAYRKHH